MTSRAFRSRIRAGLPPGRRALASVIAELYGHLGVGTLNEAADLLASRSWRKDPSEISRYRNGSRKPPLGFVELLHALAIERAGLKAVRLTLGELQAIHAAAEVTICRTCTPLRKENDRLRSEYGRLLAEHEQAEPRTPGSNRAQPVRPTPLPVPSQAGDRQRGARDVAAARQAAATAAEFHASGRTGYAVSWLQDAAASLTPLESAASIALLRQQEARLAETAIGIHGRSRPEKDVIRIALELHELGLPDDAGAILRAAIE